MPVKIFVDPLTHDAGSYGIPITISLTDRTRRAVPRSEVLIRLDGNDWHRQQTDEHGRFTIIAPNIPPGGNQKNGVVVIEAINVAFPSDVDRKVVNIPQPASATPLPVEVFLGTGTPVLGYPDQLKYHVKVMLRDTNNNGIPNQALDWECAGQSGVATTSAAAGREGIAEHDLVVSGVGKEYDYKIVSFALRVNGTARVKGPTVPTSTLPIPAKLSAIKLFPDSGTPTATGIHYRVLLVAEGTKDGETVGMNGVTAHWNLQANGSGDATTLADGNVWFDVNVSSLGTFRLTAISGIKTAHADLEGPKPITTTSVELGSIDLLPDAGKISGAFQRYRVLFVAKGKQNGKEVPMDATAHWTCDTDSGDVNSTPTGSNWFDVNIATPGPNTLTAICGTLTKQVILQGPATPVASAKATRIEVRIEATMTDNTTDPPGFKHSIAVYTRDDASNLVDTPNIRVNVVGRELPRIVNATGGRYDDTVEVTPEQTGQRYRAALPNGVSDERDLPAPPKRSHHGPEPGTWRAGINKWRRHS